MFVVDIALHHQNLNQRQMETMNTFETLFKKQQTLIENWADTSKKIFETNYTSLTAPIKQGTELLTENFQAQKVLLEGGIQSKNILDNLKQTPEYFQKWLSLQNEFTQKWIDLYQDFSATQLSQNKENSVKFSDSFKSTYGDWEKFVKESGSKLSDEIKNVSTEFPFFASFIKGYEGLNEFWKPILENGVVNGVITKENFNKYFPQSEFNKIVDSLVGLNSTENFKKTTLAFDKFFNEYATKIQELQDSAKKSADSYFEQAEQLYVGTPAEPLYTLYKDFVSSLGDIKPAIGNFDVQKQSKQLTENYLKGRKLYLEYIETSINFQQKVYAKAKDSMTDTIEKFWEVYQKDGKTPAYDEFLTSWLKIMQQSVSEILKSEEFGSLKSEVTSMREKVVKIADELLAEYAKVFQAEGHLAKFKEFELPKLNDLKIVEGIGPKIEELLIKSGISTWEILSNSSIDTLKEVLASAGKLYNRHDPSTWAEQARLASEGKFEELKNLQTELFKGYFKK